MNKRKFESGLWHHRVPDFKNCFLFVLKTKKKRNKNGFPCQGPQQTLLLDTKTESGDASLPFFSAVHLGLCGLQDLLGLKPVFKEILE